jgi:tetratricopeptide (TPR) repeat protein
VISRTSTQQYQDKPRNLCEIGKQRGAAHVLEGSVQKSGDSVRVSVQLITAHPAFSLARSRLCRAHSLVYWHYTCCEPGVVTTSREDAKQALDNARKLQPDSPDTLLALAYQYWVLGNYECANTTFRRVNKMLPRSSEVLSGLALIARRDGHWDESITYLEQALVLDPRNAELLENAAGTYKMFRQFPAALKLYDRALDILPNDPFLLALKVGLDVLQHACDPGTFKVGPKVGPTARRSNISKALRGKAAVKRYWEIVSDKLSKSGWTWGCIAAVDSDGRIIWIADADRDDGKRFVARADELLTASEIRSTPVNLFGNGTS